MDKRTYESPMDWEYQNTAPMDPSSPFTQSTKQAKQKNIFGSSSNLGAFPQSSFARTQSSPSKPVPATPMQPIQSPSIFRSSRIQRTTTAPPFRNPAFTTPRRPFDMDALSEASPAESSPAVTEVSEFPETPDHDQSIDMSHMTMTPASMNRHRSLSPKKASGKNEILKPMFAARDKIRKRKRYNGDKDISGYRLPYRDPGEGDSDYESDESTFQPNKPQRDEKKNRGDEGWFARFLSTVQRHPYAPSILGYWLNLAFGVISMTSTLWVGWTVLSGLREDFKAAQSLVRNELSDEIFKCRNDYIDNRCEPIEQRLPAMYQMCEQWLVCMNKNPDHLKKVQLGAKNIVEIINDIVDTMSYKTIALLGFAFTVILFSGRSLYRTAHDYPDFTRHAPAPFSQPHPSEHTGPPQVYWQAIRPQTPRHHLRRLPSNEETPETDVSPPPKFKTLLPPETPSGRRTPFRMERSRSPTKARSPTKYH